MAFIHSVARLLLFGGLLPSICASDADVAAVSSHLGPDLASIAIDENGLTNAINSPVEIHEVIVTLEQISGQPNTPRHIVEKKRLLETFVKLRGSLLTNHPRYRVLDALYGFASYRKGQKAELDRLRVLYKHTSKAQKSLLNRVVQYSQKFERIDAVLVKNQELCDRIVKTALEFYDIPAEELRKHIKDSEAAGKKGDKIAVSQALKHYVRDWTETGKHERDGPFRCLLKTLKDTFRDRFESAPVEILLPGAGLGRLGYDIAALGGFQVTINEWSMYMNTAYRHLEANRMRHCESVHPFIDSWSHHASEADMHRRLDFPDATLNASSVLMVEGDFTTVFSKQQAVYDVVLTYFFLDTARNLVTYLDTIKRLLRPGGRWINLGPLLYGTGPFVQLALDEIVEVTEEMGFEYLETDASCGELTFEGGRVRGMEAVYGFDDRALTKNAYKAQFWVARRVSGE